MQSQQPFATLPLALHCAESIAFYNGEVREVGVAMRCLNSLIDIARLRIKWSACLSLWTNYYSYATILAPAFITAPMYFRGEIEFGIISQVLLSKSAFSKAYGQALLL